MSPGPVLLPPDAFDHFYLGGANIAALRGNEPGERRPEEWLGSTVQRWGEPENGLTQLDMGVLRDLIDADPVGWLGADHVARWGANPAVLVKLLDAGQRLPVHVHPTQNFARSHLDCPFGKTEAWVVLEGQQQRGTVYIGTNRPVAHHEWAEMVAAQATAEMLELLNPIEVGVGDAIVVPSGTPHCTGEGLFVLELQEPTDFSLLLEWDGFAIDGTIDGHIDLGYDTALAMVRPDALSAQQLDALVRRHDPPTPSAQPLSLMPDCAESYFRAWSLVPGDNGVTLPSGFGILLVTEGSGFLRFGASAVPVDVKRGEAYVIPAAAHPITLEGSVQALLSQPPAPTAPEPVEWDSAAG